MFQQVKFKNTLKTLFSPFKKSIPWYLAYFLVVVYFATILNAKLVTHFYDLALESKASSYFFLLTPPLVVISFLSIVFLMFSFKYVFKTVFAFLLPTGAAVAYYAYKYGVIFDYDMMINLLQTNVSEAKSYYSWVAVFVVLFLGVVPAIILLKCKLVWPKTYLGGLGSRVLILVVAISTIGLISLPYYQNYASIARNNNILRKEISPYNYVWYGIKAIRQTYFPKQVEFTKLGEDSFIDNPQERPEIFVIVLGETARANNFNSNGYHRDTTPYTEQEKHFIRFAPVKTCGTATAVSVPCMFSNLTKAQYDEDKAYNQSSLVDILEYSGYKVAWYDNDGGCKGVCKRVPHEVINPYAAENSKYCKDGSCYDAILLDRLHKRLHVALKNKENTVIFLHLIGSHGPTYYQRVPKDQVLFTPTCDRADIENCKVEEIVNSYDNTIAYTDYILKGVVDTLEEHSQDFGTAMFYISDHGESLGEYGLFLHGTPYSVAPNTQTHVPMMGWFSKSFIDDHNMNMECLRKNAKSGDFSQDNFFHSMLGILDVNTKLYDDNLDVFKSCRIWIKHDTKGELNSVFKEKLYLGKKDNNAKVKTSMLQNTSLNKG